MLGESTMMFQSQSQSQSQLQSQLGTAGMSMAQTAVLGDSQGSIAPVPVSVPVHEQAIPEEDLDLDGGVGSMLGESYVDGKRPTAGLRSGGGEGARGEDGEDDIEDGGVLALLGQIYGTGVNLKGRGRGPPKAI